MNILLTGAPSGIGNALFKEYQSLGHHIYGIDFQEMNPEEHLTFFQADIQNQKRLEEIRSLLAEQNIKLDMIVNIAGIHRMASLVETDPETLKRVIDINLIGTMMVNRTFHPLLKEKGRIILVTSEVASFDPLPFNGLYNVSKTALECYAQALRQELNLISQKVITFRPGATETKLQGGSLTGTEKLASETKLYQRQAGKFLHFVKKFMGKPMSREKMASFICKKSLKKHPKLTYKKHQNPGLFLLHLLPKRTQCWIIKELLK